MKQALTAAYFLGWVAASFGLNDHVKDRGKPAGIAAALTAGAFWPLIVFCYEVNSIVGKTGVASK